MTHEKLTRWAVFAALAFAFVLPASASWKENVLYSFQGIPDGATPVGSVVFDSAGNIYGATQDGGSEDCNSIYQCGTVYELSKENGLWTETVLYVFQGNAKNDGASPFGGLVMDGSGNLYGTTAYGGTGDCVLLGSKLGCGTVFELLPPAQKGGAWTETVLYSFPSSQYGYVPWGDLVFDKAGNLYGSTIFGGGKGTTCDPYYQYCGAVFELSPPKKKGGAWTEKVLHAFAGGTDGKNPNGGLLLDDEGVVYGTTSIGGNQLCDFGKVEVGCGVVFELVPPANSGGKWAEQIIYRFTDASDGASPNGGLLFDAQRRLYGSAAGGGSTSYGTVFRLSGAVGPQGWSETTLYTFMDRDDGEDPGPLTFDQSGTLYGTSIGGQSNRGVIFQLSPPRHGDSWSLSVLYSFKGAPDGDHPAAKLVFDSLWGLYSSTQWGGTGTNCITGEDGCGTVFKVSK
jgi:uncharacterized repeat protein (TIGR03803 family)